MPCLTFYCQVVVVIPQSGTFSLYDFPLIFDGRSLNSWNIPYLNLSRLPVLAVDDRKRSAWLNAHIALGFSDQEREQKVTGTEMQPLTQLKDSIHAMTMHYIGHQTINSKRTRIVGLDRTSDGGIDTVIFITDLRLDLPSHTFVLDAFVMPLQVGILGTLGPLLGRISHSGALVSVVVSAEELVVWKRLLPTLVERCRTWKHKTDCNYIRHGSIPLSIEHAQNPICSCGQGIVTDAFKAEKQWAPFTPYVTQVAISPFFAVSYLHSVDGKIKKLSAEIVTRSSVSASTRTQCIKCKKQPPQVTLSVCSTCKAVSYCGKACQTADWKAHKPVCKSPTT